MTRTPSANNPFALPSEVASYPMLYRALIRPIREADFAEGNRFVWRYLEGPQASHYAAANQIASVWDVHSAVTCPDDLLIYLKDIVGFDRPLDYITDGLSTIDLRRLIGLAIPLWAERFSELGTANLIRLLTGRNPLILNWFYWRSILGEVIVGEEQVGYDFWLIGGAHTYFDEYFSQIRLMLSEDMDRRLVIDLLELERVASERTELALVDFLDQFDLARDKWETLTGTPATVETDKTFLLTPGCDEKALMLSDSYADYIAIHKFRLDIGATLLTRFYVDDWAGGTYYEAEVSANTVILNRYVAAAKSVLATVDTTTLGFPILEEQWYKIRVVCVDELGDARIKIFIDGNQVVNLADAGGASDGEVVIGSIPSNPVPSANLVAFGRYDDFAGGSFALDYIRDGGAPVITTPSGAPGISATAKFGAGSLEMDNAGAAEILDYDGASVIDAIGNVGTVEFFYRPNYTGSPLTHQYIFKMGLPGSVNNEVLIHHFTSGVMGVIGRDSAGGSITNVSAAWAPTAGQWYHVSVNFDWSAGLFRTAVYVDGVLHADGAPATGTRTQTSTRIRLGAWYSGAGAPRYQLDSLRIYDAVLRTAPFTPPVAEYATPPYTPGGNLKVDNVEIFRVPLRQALLQPELSGGLVVSTNFYTP